MVGAQLWSKNGISKSRLGVVSAPLWNNEAWRFAGMLTVSDIIHLIQYYWHTSSYDNAAADVEHFRLESLRGAIFRSFSHCKGASDWHTAILEIEKTLKVPPPPLLSVHPLRPLFDACKLLITSHARRLPLIDHDAETGTEVIVSVLTQYRALKFIAINVRQTYRCYVMH